MTTTSGVDRTLRFARCCPYAHGEPRGSGDALHPRLLWFRRTMKSRSSRRSSRARCGRTIHGEHSSRRPMSAHACRGVNKAPSPIVTNARSGVMKTILKARSGRTTSSFAVWHLLRRVACPEPIHALPGPHPRKAPVSRPAILLRESRNRRRRSRWPMRRPPRVSIARHPDRPRIRRYTHQG